MRRKFAILLATVMICSLAACGSGSGSGSGSESDGSGSGNGGGSNASSSGGVGSADSDENNASGSQSGSEGTAAVSIELGKLYFIGDEDILHGLYLWGNQFEEGDTEKRTDNLRSIYELGEWVEIYPDAEKKSGIRLWVLEHRDDQSYYETAQFSDMMPGFVTWCDLNEDPDDPDWNWGSFYINEYDWNPGYYDFVFTYNGKAIARMLTRFYYITDLNGKTLQDLTDMMNAENASLGGSSDGSGNGGSTGGDTVTVGDAGSTGSDDKESYNFPGYTNEGSWPDADTWAGMGLPDLQVSDAGSVSISDKEWIYPLNAEDGVMFEARPGSSHFDELVAVLNDAGIEGEDESDSFDSYYVARYTYNGAPMEIKISEYDTGKLVILVRYKPE